MSEKLSKLRSVFKKDGFIVAMGKTAKYAAGALKRRFRVSYKRDFAKRKDEYERIISEALAGDYDRILIWRSSFGWNVPLFQRPQHVSSSLSKKRCLVFYEVTQMTDKTKGVEKLRDSLYLVNFENPYVTNLLLSYTDKSLKPKYLQFYSTDWTLSVEYVKAFISKGYKILYEYIDDINPALAGTKELPKNISDKYEFAMSHPDDVLVAASADLLRDDVLSKRGDKNFVFSTNGVDYEFFKDLSGFAPRDEKLEEALSRGLPTVGYYGAMASWLDYELLKEIDKTGRFTFILIGIRYDDSLDQSGVLDLDNVVFLGSKDYKTLKYYASKIDVLTIPFVINDITRATSPLKLFEYMALGKPIVTTAMNECMKYETPLIAHDRNEFISELDAAIEKKNDREYLEALDNEAKANSWDSKTDGIIEMMKIAEGV